MDVFKFLTVHLDRDCFEYFKFFNLVCWGLVANAQEVPVAGYSTSLNLDGPIEAGMNQTLTGGGAPASSAGVYVELWRCQPNTTQAESVQSVAVEPGGFYSFVGVDVEEGENYFVTLSRSWHFNTDNNAENWNSDVSIDSTLEVSNGTLKIRARDGNGDGWIDPYFRNNFAYNSEYYRVIEIRLRNPAPVDSNILFLFWGGLHGLRDCLIM